MKTVPLRLLQPWAITAEGLQLVWSVWSRGELFAEAKEKALQSREGEELKNTRSATKRDGIAIIPVSGPLFRHASILTAISGATSYADLRKDLQAAIDDSSVKAILLDVNSPGGEVDGCAELSDAIFAARGKKPIVAYVGGLGASAAYWIASAADKIVCAETSMLGSIGVRTALIDDSERDAKQGVRTVEIISSQSPGKRDLPLDEEVVAKTQRHVDELAEVFIGTVARNRGVTSGEVTKRFGGGDVLIGKKAVAAGLADSVGNFEQTLSELVASSQSATGTFRGETRMAKKMKAEGAPPEPMPEGSEDEKCSKCGGSGEMDDGEKCSTCGGSGKAEAGASKYGGGDGDNDEDDKMPNEAEDDEDKEKAALATLAAKHGLPATASRQEILMAANAGSVPLANVSALVEKQVKERFEAEKRSREKAEAKERAKKLAAEAVRGGYDDGDKGALISLAEINFAAAERIAAPFVRQAQALYGRVTQAGGPAGSERPMSGSDLEVKQMGAVRIVKHGKSLSAEAKALAKKENISYEKALDRVVAERPELYQAYLNGL